jgi:diaminopimelate epimerase
MTDFLKMHGLGNDFVILDERTEELGLTPERIARIADRHMGVGCDQLIVLEKSDKADVFMRIYNPDASEAGACGNATRCVASLIMKEKNASAISIETISGILPCTRDKNLFTVDMGEPRLEWDQIPLSHEMGTLDVKGATCVNMGNPHAVIFVPDVEAIDLQAEGRPREIDLVFPKRANIEFAQVLDPSTIRARVWERGAGVTLACGSGACAVAVAAVRRNLTGRKVTVKMDGGDLQLEWRESDNRVYMTGPVQLSFKGSLTF